VTLGEKQKQCDICTIKQIPLTLPSPQRY
jgi:hypothetical protein